MSQEILGLILLGLLFIVILSGFPISFTLFFLGMVFGYLGLGERVFYLMTYQTFSTMMDTVLAAVAMFTFMGYVLESAGLMKRLFHAVQLLCGRMHGSLFLATIFTATLFAAATGIVGASVTIIALMAAPVMLKSRYDTALCAGTDTNSDSDSDAHANTDSPTAASDYGDALEGLALERRLRPWH